MHADGSARAIVTNAWPDGAPQDEAGLYETTLGDDVLAELRALAADPQLLGLPAALGEVRADSGQTGLSLAGERKTLGRVRRAARAAAAPPRRACASCSARSAGTRGSRSGSSSRGAATISSSWR